ncbi:hypothetical protein BCR42DRAFT_397280 [Absidia repens]|uniref:DUF7721 domain-containing protein n=1 Tax=Absidia repens TaxID=90262 RepID=A0A1X2I1F1_9FUNG|nr:hypothetical protein BCR42DRAFT_397280 [Absidia repens]
MSQVPQENYKRLNPDDAIRYAAEHSGKGEDMFEYELLGALGDDYDDSRDFSLGEVNGLAELHDSIYIKKSTVQPDGFEIGNAAAFQALKMTTHSDLGTGAIPDKSKFIGLAMGEAVKLLQELYGGDSEKYRANLHMALRVSTSTALHFYSPYR